MYLIFQDEYVYSTPKPTKEIIKQWVDNDIQAIYHLDTNTELIYDKDGKTRWANIQQWRSTCSKLKV